MSPGARRLLAGALLLPLLVLLSGPDASAAGQPTLSARTTKAAPGAMILFTIDGWPVTDVVTVQVCGNDALRGSSDCDAMTGASVQSRTGGPERQLLRVAIPPAPCPCVLRAADVESRRVVTIPFEIVGASIGPLVHPNPAAAAPPVSVTASLPERSTSFVGRLRRILGGPSHRRLLIVVHNSTPYPLSGVVVTAALGRHLTGGAPVDPPEPFDLAVGQTRTVVIPVKLEAPVHGRYVVSGQAYVGGQSVPYAVHVDVTPWGIVVLAALVLLAVAVVIAVAIRRRRDGASTSGTDSELQVTDAGTVSEQAPLDGSPVVPVS